MPRCGPGGFLIGPHSLEGKMGQVKERVSSFMGPFQMGHVRPDKSLLGLLVNRVQSFETFPTAGAFEFEHDGLSLSKAEINKCKMKCGLPSTSPSIIDERRFVQGKKS